MDGNADRQDEKRGGDRAAGPESWLPSCAFACSWLRSPADRRRGLPGARPAARAAPRQRSAPKRRAMSRWMPSRKGATRVTIADALGDSETRLWRESVLPGTSPDVIRRLEVLEDARQAGRQKVTAPGQLGGVHLALEVERADHAPLLLGDPALAMVWPEIRHHGLAGAQQGGRHRVPVVHDPRPRESGGELGGSALRHR